MIPVFVQTTSTARPGHCSGRVLLSRAILGLLVAVFATLTRTAHADAPAPLHIVLAAPLSGPQAEFGIAQRTAIETAAARINASGGILGRQISLTVHDDACRRDTAVALARTITTTAPLAVIGHMCASAAEAVAPIYQQAGVLMLSAGNFHPGFTARRAGPLIFRVGGRDDRQGFDAARRLRVLAGKDGGIVVVHDRTAMARAVAGSSVRTLMAAAPGGAPAPPLIGIVAGETDYPKAVAEVTAARPSAIMFAGFPAEAAILLRRLRAAGVMAPLVLSDANATPELAAHAGRLLDDRVEVMLPVPTDIARDQVAPAEPPFDLHAIPARDAATALRLIAEAARGATQISPAELATALSSPTRAGGPAFDAIGDAVGASFAPYRWHDGAWRRVR